MAETSLRKVITFNSIKDYKRILVTSALPYANGPIHIGHLVEYIETDIYVRFLKLLGLDAIYCCADDTHGTPIEINAAEHGVTPEKFIARWLKEHQEDFKKFLIEFDSYYSTNSPENKRHSDAIFLKLKEKGFIEAKEIEQYYCEHDKKWLPDRYIKGKCPKCSAEHQYGDVCEKCNAAYKTIDLINPYCVLCKNAPVRRKSRHYFFKLSTCSDKLKDWLEKNENLQNEIRNFVLQWIEQGLEDWDITRDGPYFGFRIPGEENKYYYVWLDAPIGYISSTENYCNTHKDRRLTVDDYWRSRNAAIIHYIGKDITYFHLLFWPAILMVSEHNLPEHIFVHGFLTVQHEKMSKSRGTFLTAKDYLAKLDPEFLRFYYASNLSSAPSDVDLSWKDFRDRINHDLLGNVANFAYRVLSFHEKHFEGRLEHYKREEKIQEELKEVYGRIEHHYTGNEFRKAVQEILEVGAIGNRAFQDREPWKLIKTDKEAARQTCLFGISVVRDLAILLKPILPRYAEKLEAQLGMKNLAWRDLGTPLKKQSLGKAEIVFHKLEDKSNIFAGHAEERKKGEEGKKKEKESGIPLNLKTAKILKAEQHPDADKLIVMHIDLGSEQRQIVAGIKQWYKAEELVGKNLIIVTNLKAARLRGIESNGMLLAASEGNRLEILSQRDAVPGTAVTIGGDAADDGKQIDFKEFHKIKWSIKDKAVFCEGKRLKVGGKAVTVEKVSDKAKVS